MKPRFSSFLRRNIPTIIFATILLCKNILFAALVSTSNAQDFPFSVEPYSIRLWLMNLCAALILAALVALFRNKIFSTILLIFSDIWLVGNLIYSRSYNDLLNSWCLTNVSNMNGVWASVLLFLQWQDILFVVLTTIWLVYLYFCKNQIKRNLAGSAIAFSLAICCYLPTGIVLKKNEFPTNPLHSYFRDVSMGRFWYCTTFSPLGHFVNELKNLFAENNVEIDIKSTEISPFINEQNALSTSEKNLLIVFFESLESWTIGTKICEQDITPTLNTLIRSPKTTYFPKVKPQVLQGKSSDAQLIVNTGLLPVFEGATSVRFSTNAFPSLAHALPNHDRKIFVPTTASSWNQGAMTVAFGFDSLNAEVVSDRKIINAVTHEITKNCSKPFFYFCTTMASHAPFIEYADSGKIVLPTNFPTEFGNYIQSVNYTDKCLKILIDSVLENENLRKNTTIVITGDHTIFPETRRKEFKNLAQIKGENLQFEECVPLIVYEPNKTYNGNFGNETTLQMDIYPTLLYLMDAENYFWKGFGKNLWKDETRNISEHEANVLSDKLIQANYFVKYDKITD